jgi:hypothetical protein
VPPLPAVAGVIRVRILFTIAGKEDQGLRLFYTYDGSAPSVANLDTFGGVIKTEADSVLPAVLAPDKTITGFVLEDLASDTGAVSTTADSTVGTHDGTPLPADVAAVASYEIPRRYRGGHPRSYWPLGNVDDIDTGDVWQPDSVTAFSTAVVGVIDSLVGEAAGSTTIANHVAVSYYSGFTAIENPFTGRYRNVPTLRTTPLVFEVTDVVMRNYYGSQLRRRIKTSS